MINNINVNKKALILLLFLFCFCLIQTNLTFVHGQEIIPNDQNNIYLIRLEGSIKHGAARLLSKMLTEIPDNYSNSFTVIILNSSGGSLSEAEMLFELIQDYSQFNDIYLQVVNARNEASLIALSGGNLILGNPGIISYKRSLIDRIQNSEIKSQLSLFTTEFLPDQFDNSTEIVLDIHFIKNFPMFAGTAKDLSELTLTLLPSAVLNQTNLYLLSPHISEKIAQFIAEPAISVILPVFSLIAFLIDLNFPGIVGPSLAGIVVLTVFYGAHFYISGGFFLPVLLLFCGLSFLILEKFVFNGYKICKFTGLLLLLISAIIVFDNHLFSFISAAILCITYFLFFQWFKKYNFAIWLTGKLQTDLDFDYIKSLKTNEDLQGKLGTTESEIPTGEPGTIILDNDVKLGAQNCTETTVPAQTRVRIIYQDAFKILFSETL